ncbi:murein hydrolase activator EnvC family protein [Sphingomonas sp.]|uniref:murein hydrolase activator EnvC family protein n=1 Tax=Sphingomonas sp. TaxID=28214 RepID=UPI003B0017E5
MARSAVAALCALLLGAAPPGIGVLDSERATLIEAKRAAAEAETRAGALREAAQRADGEAERARTQAAALALSVRAAEQDIVAARARIALVGALQQRQRASIADRQGPILHLLAALQTMARRPAVLAVSQPGSVADLVHVRLLLADTLPVVAARTAGLRAELARATTLHTEAEQAADAMVRSRLMLADRRRELALLESTAIRRSQRLADQAADEAQRALGLGAEARDIADRLQAQQDADTLRIALERLPDPRERPGAAEGVPSYSGPPRYRLAASGRVVTGYGEVASSGVRARGLTLAVDPGVKVIAGQAATILFARPFRSYGTVVILGHGGGWTTTVTGLASASVSPGEQVSQGAAIGRAGERQPQVTTELRRGGRPVDILALTQAG